MQRWAVSFVVCLRLAVAGQSADVTVGTANARTRQKATGYLEVPAAVDEATKLPVIVINGAKPGPKLALIAGARGTEYASSVALAEIADQIPPSNYQAR